MAFINDSVGFVVGYALSPSFISKTTNGGQSWDLYQASDIGSYGLMFINENIGFNAGQSIVIKKTTDAGVSWIQKIIKDDFSNVWSVSENLAFAIGGGVYKTTDGGSTWYPTFPYDPMNLGLSAVLFVDSLTGFVGTNNDGRIYKTTDAGETWIRKTVSGSSGKINDIFFINRNIGWAVSNTGVIIRTNDNGESWTAISYSVYGAAIQFLDSLTGYALSAWFNKTIDGGYSWTQIQYPSTSELPMDLFFVDTQNGLIALTDLLFRTTNGGVSWVQISEVTDFGFGKFNWPSIQQGFINGRKSYRTNDSGHSWIDITSQIGHPIRMHSGNLYSGYGVGSGGLILKYFDSTFVPVELINFNVEIEDNDTNISWITATELNNKGFELLRSYNNDEFRTIAFIQGKGISTSINYYSFQDNNLSNGNYKYRLKQIDFDGTIKYSGIVEANLSSEKAYHIIYPNPFNSNAMIKFSLPVTGIVKVTVYNILGEEIVTLFNNIVEGGKEYSLNVESNYLSTGVYYYTIVQNRRLMVGKMLIIK